MGVKLQQIKLIVFKSGFSLSIYHFRLITKYEAVLFHLFLIFLPFSMTKETKLQCQNTQYLKKIPLCDEPKGLQGHDIPTMIILERA